MRFGSRSDVNASRTGHRWTTITGRDNNSFGPDGGSALSFYDQACDVVRSIYDRRIDTPAILDPRTYFPGADRFTARWEDIRRDALTISGNLAKIPRFHEIMGAQADISARDGRDWRMFILKAYGVEIEQNVKRCPTIASLIAGRSDVISCVLSFLAPGKHIPKHRGPFRGILRFHLMLAMPKDPNGEPASVLEIDGQEHRLADGESLLWDDTYPHEVWNRSDEVRIALLLDIWRRNMPKDMELLSRLVIGGVGLRMRLGGISYGG
jgi:aspartate beta-hydroxylase